MERFKPRAATPELTQEVIREKETALKERKAYESAEQSNREGIVYLYLERFLVSSLKEIPLGAAVAKEEFERVVEKLQKQFENVVLSVVGKKALDPSVLNWYRQIIFEYTAEKQKSVVDEERLNELSMAVCGDASPTSQGRTLFFKRFNRFPVGKIEVVHSEAYCVVTCFAAEDYNAIAPAVDETSSDGSFHRSFHLLLEPDFQPTVLLVNGAQDSVAPAERIVTHERQHFINTILQCENGIKDEILAYIRDASSSDELLESLSSPLYDYLFSDFTEEEAQKKDQAIDACAAALDAIDREVSWALEDYVPPSVKSQVRAVLVGQVADFPLEKIPEKLRQVADFYKKRNRDIHNYIDFLDVPPVLVLYMVQNIRLPAASEKVVREYEASYDQWCNAKNKVISEHFFDPKPLEVLLKKLDPLAERYKAAYEALFHDEVGVPFVVVNSQKVSSSGVLESQKQPILQVRRGADALAAAFAKFTGDELIKIFEDHRMRAQSSNQLLETIERILNQQKVPVTKLEVYSSQNEKEFSISIYYAITDSKENFNIDYSLRIPRKSSDSYYP